MYSMLKNIYGAVFGTITRLTDGWFLGLAARLVFLAVFFFYYANSFFTKVGEGVSGFFEIQGGAYFQIVPQLMDAAGYDPANLSFLAKALVFVGTYMEIILPVLVVIGLFTRAAALGMIAFIAVQTYVDINFHGADEKMLGSLFDRVPDSAISDQRTLWVFVMLVLVLRGAGYLSLDYLFAGRKSS